MTVTYLTGQVLDHVRALPDASVDLVTTNPALYPARYQQCWQALRPDAGTSPVTPHGEQLGLEIPA